MAKRKKKKAAENKGGRPPEKVSDKVDYSQLAFLCQKGATDRELAHFYHVAESTINRWKKDEKFKEVMSKSKAVANDRIKAALFSRGVGMVTGEGTLVEKHLPPDVDACKFWLVNRDGENWRLKQDINITKPIKVEFPYRKNQKKKR